jgi:hypothetical protein
MEQPMEIEFNVDEKYENEKGVFKVVAIHKDQMVIRWEDGEETRTEIALQRRIAERRQWEKRKHLADTKAAQEAQRKSSPKNKKAVFAGLAETDFKTSCYRTTWRARNQLGGAVTSEIKTNQFDFNSWANGRQPEMHVQDIKHHDVMSPADQTRFFVRVDDRNLYYGLCVARPATPDVNPTCWSALREWLTKMENAQAVHTLALNHHLTACHRAQPTAGIKSSPEDGGWVFEDSGEPLPEATLSAYFDRVPSSNPCETELFAVLAKEDAVACGRDIAPRIAQLFADLLPLYQAATSQL